jgi:integrase
MNLTPKVQESVLTAIGSVSIVVNADTPNPRESDPAMTLHGLFARWQAAVLPCHKPISAKRARAAIKSLDRLLGTVLLVAVSPNTGWDYRRQRHAEGLAPATIHYELRLLRQMCRYGGDVSGVPITSPVVRGTLPKVPARAERWLTAEELRRITAVAPEYVASVITFAVETGLRINEICQLSWDQVDLQRGELKLSEQKNGKFSVLPLSRLARATLVEVAGASACTAAGPIFLKGFQAWTEAGLRAAFYRAVEKAKIAPARFHDLRHSFATRLVQAGVDLYTVQRLGRWASYDMVQRYGHHNTESLRQALAKVG